MKGFRKGFVYETGVTKAKITLRARGEIRTMAEKRRSEHVVSADEGITRWLTTGGMFPTALLFQEGLLAISNPSFAFHVPAE